MSTTQDNRQMIKLVEAKNWKDYTLLDSGDGRKLERFGGQIIIRPDAQAMWKPALSPKEWKHADAEFKPGPGENGGKWAIYHPLPEKWQMQYQDIRFWVRISGSKHLGVFPEQASHWDWIANLVGHTKRPLRVLNLFGYTALASLAAAQAGAHITHVDASKKMVAWGRENQVLSGLAERPIRWLVDDAAKFVLREGRRNVKYDGLILDPPKFGRGPKGEVWEFFRLMPSLLHSCRNILTNDPSFVVLTAYAVPISAITLYHTFESLFTGLDGNVEMGELITTEKSGGRRISNAIFLRWNKG